VPADLQAAPLDALRERQPVTIELGSNASAMTYWVSAPTPTKGLAHDP
jgi:hypothetical protein